MDGPTEGFKPGDRVRATDPVAEMTVAEVYSAAVTYRYRCQWASPDGSARERLFRADQLRPVVPS